MGLPVAGLHFAERSPSLPKINLTPNSRLTSSCCFGFFRYTTGVVNCESSSSWTSFYVCLFLQFVICYFHQSVCVAARSTGSTPFLMTAHLFVLLNKCVCVVCGDDTCGVYHQDLPILQTAMSLTVHYYISNIIVYLITLYYCISRLLPVLTQAFRLRYWTNIHELSLSKIKSTI